MKNLKVKSSETLSDLNLSLLKMLTNGLVVDRCRGDVEIRFSHRTSIESYVERLHDFVMWKLSTNPNVQSTVTPFETLEFVTGKTMMEMLRQDSDTLEFYKDLVYCGYTHTLEDFTTDLFQCDTILRLVITACVSYENGGYNATNDDVQKFGILED